MRAKLSKYFNIYVVTALIGFFSFLYLFSFAFVISDVNSGSSRAIKQKLCKEQPEICYVEHRDGKHTTE